MNKIISSIDKIIQEIYQYKDLDTHILSDILLVIDEVDKSWSGSILDYHSNVYYRNFSQPPKNAYFSIEWGIELHPTMKLFNQYASDFLPPEGSIGDWVEYSDSEIVSFIFREVDENKFISKINECEEIYKQFLKLKDEVLSLMYINNLNNLNPYLGKIVSDVEKMQHLDTKVSLDSYIARFAGKISTRDFKVSKSPSVNSPLHIRLQSKVVQALSEFDCINKLEKSLGKIKNHIEKYPSSLKENGDSMKSQQINIQNMQGIIGNISGGNIQQNIHDGIHITEGDFCSLAKFLIQKGIPDSELSELEIALNEDTPPTDVEKFGEKVSRWIGNIVAKASSGIIDIPLATIAGLLTNAISKYYGLS